MTPDDLGMAWIVGKTRSRTSSASARCARRLVREDRKQLVGLLTGDPEGVLEEGAQIVADPNRPIPMPMLGHVTSGYFSPNLGRSIAMGLIRNGHQRMGETVHYPLPDGSVIEAEICSTVFFDPKGDRQNV